MKIPGALCSRYFWYQDTGDNQLQGQNDRNPNSEFGMLGFVPDVVHTQKTADAAAEKCNTHKGFLRDAPAVFLRFMFIHKHKNEANCIDYNKIQDNQFHKKSFREGFYLKKVIGCFLCLLLLTGCAAEETFETVADELAEPAMAEIRDIVVALPEGMASPTAQSDGETLYQGDGFEIMLQTLPGGDLSATVQTITGYEKGSLTVIETEQGDISKYELVWASAGENGDRIGRAAILDDGSYHYAVTVLADADRTEEYAEVWDILFSSVMLS